jgi:thiol-disulfide isomerase/thioredoxin
MKLKEICCALGVAALITGCGEKPASPNAAKSADAGTRPAEQPALSPADASALGVGGPQSEGDKAWAEVEKSLETLIRPPERPADPTKEQIAELKRKQAEAMTTAAAKVRDFYTTHTNHANTAEAREHEQGLLSVAARLGNTNAAVLLEKLEKAKLADPNLPEDERLQLRVQQVQRAASAKAGDDQKLLLAEMESGVRKLQAEFPKRTELSGLLLQVAEEHINQGDVEKARKMAQEVVDARAEGELKTAAQELLTKVGRIGKPLEIKFKAVDGRDVDLVSMKGKVVLIDFWATWCGPCMAELPHVKEAYEKLNPKGFEIVGISLDQKLPELKKVLAEEKMTWPQYFEESGENKYAEQYGITGIPTMWLVDKKGLLRDLNARENLAEKVEKLMAEN